jgi:hypothetical protein
MGFAMARSNISKIKYAGMPIIVLLTVCIWLFTRETGCRFPAANKLVVSSVEYGTFDEWIPLTGIFLQDTFEYIHDVRVQIDEMYLQRMAVGLKATTELEDSVYTLELSHIYPHVVDGRITVDMNFVGVKPPARERESLRLRLELSEPTTALLIPTGGFYFDTRGKWVFVVKDGVAVRRDIRLGRKNSSYYQVIEGLKPGEQVITSSYQRFKDQQSVDLSLLTDTDQ